VRLPVRLSALAVLLALIPGLANTSVFAQDATPAAIATPASVSPVLPATFTDSTGKEITITDVSRIVPLNGDIAEIIWDLGLGANIVGADVSATYPPGLQDLPSIGFARQLSAEGILSLEPTVVIGDTTAGPADVISQVRDAGIPVVIIKSYTDITAPFEKVADVSAALGVSAQGDALAASVQKQLDDAKALAATAETKPRVVFLYIRGAAIQLIGGKGSGADTLIDMAGGIDGGTEAGINGFMPITAESLVAAAPDVILVMSGGLESIGGIDGLMQIPGIAETPAGENGRILAFDDQYLLGLGPRIGSVVTDLVYGLHPELAPAGTPVATPEF
jgi:iron complex transport system substrate-binding protein